MTEQSRAEQSSAVVHCCVHLFLAYFPRQMSVPLKWHLSGCVAGCCRCRWLGCLAIVVVPHQIDNISHMASSMIDLISCQVWWGILSVLELYYIICLLQLTCSTLTNAVQQQQLPHTRRRRHGHSMLQAMQLHFKHALTCTQYLPLATCV